PNNILFTSGYLLMLLIGGLLVYDGMLRTENLFENLGRKLVVSDRREDAPFTRESAWLPVGLLDESDQEEVSDGAVPISSTAADRLVEKVFESVGAEERDYISQEDLYPLFHDDLRDSLEDTTDVPIVGEVTTAFLFAPLFVVQFAVVWMIQLGPQNLEFPVTLWGNVLLDLFIVVVAFQFLVLIKKFGELITDSVQVDVVHVGAQTDGGTRKTTDRRLELGERRRQEIELLTYRPFHPDGRGGFRDFGKFATRVNVLLILAGLYVTYRLYVQGGRTLPEVVTQSGAAHDISVSGIVWVVSYVGPVIAYTVAAGAWLYYSFWQLHLKMAREREEQYTEELRRRRMEPDGNPAERIGIASYRYEWLEIRASAPVWPINYRQLMSLASGTLAPVVLSFSRFF
ncbi:MAG: hypothetical protein R3324_15610, partial [Halobacteriales archaeon]|nr:hypothetical protein [Halobacteriales archaeon]